MNKRKSILLAIFLLIFILWVIRAWIVNDLSTTGANFALLKQEIKRYQHENWLLREEVLRQQALTTIDAKAKHEGYIQATPMVLWKKQ